jgi:predicted transcriptional regulator of viral defense system
LRFKASLGSAADYIEELQINGRLTFTTQDAVQALGRSVPAVRAQLRRLKEKGHVAAPAQGFHVIVPPKYRRLGCLPPDQFISQLMGHLGEPYYVALLSAAACHGAAHQAPMVFQVMVPRARRSLVCGGVQVDFVARRDMERTPVVARETPTSVLRVASPAATALELVGYPERCGFLDNIATVLAELAELIDGGALAAEATRAPVAWVQRLGYLLALVEQGDLAAHLDGVLTARNIFPVALAPWLGMEGAPRDPRWQVAINTTVEPDL